MSTYYNDNDPSVCAWMKGLMDSGLITKGIIDERSIEDISPQELKSYRRIHHFAGIGGWDYALQLAGFPSDRPVWSASLPCQAWSCAGKQEGATDRRNLWPSYIRLVRECKPELIFGEQVPAAIGLGWLDGIFTDLEAEGYTCGAVVFGAGSVGAPQKRSRIFWVASAKGRRLRTNRSAPRQSGHTELGEQAGELVQPGSQRDWAGISGHRKGDSQSFQRPSSESSGSGELGWMGVPIREGLEVRRCESIDNGQELATTERTSGALCELGDSESDEQRRDRLSGSHGERITIGGSSRDVELGIATGIPGRVSSVERRQDSQTGGTGEFGFWSDYEWHWCRDEKFRRIPTQVESVVQLMAPGLPEDMAIRISENGFPLAPKIKGRVQMLKGFGNSIVPHCAAVFIRAFLELEREGKI